jgi:hypothetical protein
MMRRLSMLSLLLFAAACSSAPSATPSASPSEAPSTPHPTSGDPTAPPAEPTGATGSVCLPAGSEEGDPGTVCVEPGYYVRNASDRAFVVRLAGGLASDLAVPAKTSGVLTLIGAVDEAGDPVTIEVLTADCERVKVFEPGDESLVVIRIARDRTVKMNSAGSLPARAMPEGALETTDACA